MDNKILWEKYLKGDKEALSIIFRIFFDDLYTYGSRLTRNSEIVRDSMQDMFLKLWKNRTNLRVIDNIKPYLFKALRRHIISNLKWENSFVDYEHQPEELFQIEFSHEDFLVSRNLDNETREKLIKALNKLTRRQREAIYLRYFEEMDFESISEIMSMKIQSVRNSIYRGLLVLREIKIVLLMFLMANIIC
jgi:RNA polymerase sigma factor (sigma-70 family)